MTTKLEIYKCDICGNVVEVLDAPGGGLKCCGQKMTLAVAKIEDTGTEKHRPVVAISDDDIRVEVGSVPHPMEDDHYIQWIESICCDGKFRQMAELKPGDDPKALFFNCNCGSLVVRAFCNKHGLWKA
jgi:superoxide reductase